MAFELPNLPYDYDALAPYMSRETLEYHHDKHHLAYVTNGNKLAEEAGLSNLSVEEIVKKSYGTNQPLFNNAGQHYNHIHFWKWLKKGGGGTSLPGKLDAAIKSDLGGYDKFRTDFIAAGTGQFGSGWPGCRSRTASSKSPRPRTAKTRWCTAPRRSSASTSGSIPTTSTTATPGRSTSRLSSTISSTGTTSSKCTRRR